ncbi:SIR2 family protein [Luteolibacter sp. Y139]|uniref:Protein argonaute n=1 Tax=Luteolibacter soli TaxID=3135280 RepID=A0ABU9AU10_9BACT
MPTAQRCIWEWKRDIFSTQNPRLRESVGELTLAGTKKRIQTWLDQRPGYPPEGDASEYSFFAQECYPTSEDRRAFFQRYVASSRPHLGYSLLPLLAQTGLLRTIWTTNFDGLVSRSCAAANITCIEVGLDSAQRAARSQSQGEIRLVSLHGDYRYDELKNTSAELQRQDQALREELLHELQDHDLIVVGYSGRDDSLMEVLRSAYGKRNPCRLFWCGYGAVVPEPVDSLFRTAREAGNSTYFIDSGGFDDLFTRLALRHLDGDLLAQAKGLLDTMEATTSPIAPFTAPSQPPTSIIKGNAYPLIFPSHVLKVPLRFPPDVRPRTWLEDNLPVSKGAIVGFKDCALAFAETSDVLAAFSDAITGEPISDALTEVQLEKDPRILSLVRRALVQSIAKLLGLGTDSNRRVWETTSYDKHTFNGTRYGIHRAMSLRLESINGKTHVAIMPEVVATLPDGQLADFEATKDIRIKVYGYQHNDVFDRDISYWVRQMKETDLPAIGGGTFRISRAPIYAGLVQRGFSALPEDIQRHVTQRGLVVPDANLVFSSANGSTEVRNVNPLKGLVQNRPWDFQLTSSGLSPSIEIAAICPPQDAGKIRRFLSQFQESSDPGKSERDYVQPFPGFSGAFGIPLKLPSQGQPGWATLDDSISGTGLVPSKMLAHRICQALDSIRYLKPSAVVAIFVPERWAPFEKVDADQERFDLHHFVKSYAARHGQSTQFIRERTALSTQPCRVRWWLSLALYSKAQRTPWRLDSLDDNTAFVGIGYSIDGSADRGHHILLGCSHLYNSRGEGLQFRLGRVESPIMRGRNPYMSIDDARRTGETIRELFYDAKMRLPTRVVVHKRTPFIEEERKGLLQGLEGVENVELIEITIEESLRYLASKLVNGKPEIDKYPIPRGAAVVLNSTSTLLWVHGVTPSAQNPSWKYYQGKRRIPTPLLIRRYSGKSDVTQVASEILGLSKMNWNTFDYYSRLPATLDSASAIARMGSYLTGFGHAPYDYRLLI